MCPRYKITLWPSFAPSRPQFSALYFNEPDRTGHAHGPDSPELNATLGVVDKAIARLWEGLQQRNISDCVNIIIVSDHGMSLTNTSKYVYASEVSAWIWFWNASRSGSFCLATPVTIGA